MEVPVRRGSTVQSSFTTYFPGGGGGGTPYMAYTGRFRPKRVPFSGFRYIEG